MQTIVRVGSVEVGAGRPLALIAGPCVIESREACLELAGRLAEFAAAESVPLIFKASYDKANRSSHASFRGPGLEKGLEVLAEARASYGLPVLTDVHSELEASRAAAFVDALQIPAFLCRQTDLVLAAAATGRPVNVKKGQFMAPWEMRNVVAKIESAGNRRILLTERGVSFGYNNLVVDMRSLPLMRETGYPVVFDATHAVQRPGGAGDRSAGDARYAPVLARAAVAAGCDAVFVETHADVGEALSDGANMIALADLPALWRALRRIHEAVAQ
ncbi:MAG: 3-deoxy-8-phosphooctulonate synthase [Lentisphaerae bacterium]|nr:3-deoxy-8-phosphooctulonate synthase [Lentisphaerota bacterium]